MITVAHHKDGTISIEANGKSIPIPPPGQAVTIMPRTEYRSRRTSTEESRKHE
jgi:hypothetical protein